MIIFVEMQEKCTKTASIKSFHLVITTLASSQTAL